MHELHSESRLDFDYLARHLGEEKNERSDCGASAKNNFMLFDDVCKRAVRSLRLSESVSCQRILCNEIIVVGTKQKVCQNINTAPLCNCDGQ